MHPLDLVKVRFQLGEVPRTNGRFGRALYDVLAEAVRADGWKGLYRGLGPNIVGGAGSWGLYFLL
jgi:solute carrier family 25 folate transporter 32